MFPSVPPTGPHKLTPNNHQLALLCIKGSTEAGVQLVQRLWETGDREVTVRRLLTIANVEVTPRVFDALADALDQAHIARYRAENLPPQPESD